MILFLRGLFLLILITMLGVTSWAGSHCPLFAVPAAVYRHPWFIATMADAYCGFLTFFVWVAYQQTAALARVLWFLAIMLLGNIAMSAYCLNELCRTPRDTRPAELLVRRHDGAGLLGGILALLGAAVLLLG